MFEHILKCGKMGEEALNALKENVNVLLSYFPKCALLKTDSDATQVIDVEKYTLKNNKKLYLHYYCWE